MLERRRFPLAELRLLASARSAGNSLSFAGQQIPVHEATPQSFSGIDVAFFSAGATRSRELAPYAIQEGALVVDNSSAFRMDPEIPLVVPEINLSAVRPEDRLVANPNCSAIILLMAVHPLRKLGSIERLIVSTYQSASGGGASMMQRLIDETKEHLMPNGSRLAPNTNYPTYAFNLFSHNTPINSVGYNEEESKVIEESRKILGMPDLRINVTCVRVPVLRAHSETVTVEFSGAAPSVESVRELYQSAAGIRLVDERGANQFPTPLEASGQDDVLVGRIRHDLSNGNALCLFVSGDQLLKGAALNAVQIAEGLMTRDGIAARA